MRFGGPLWLRSTAAGGTNPGRRRCGSVAEHLFCNQGTRVRFLSMPSVGTRSRGPVERRHVAIVKMPVRFWPTAIARSTARVPDESRVAITIRRRFRVGSERGCSPRARRSCAVRFRTTPIQ
jgi:hypothetical protein